MSGLFTTNAGYILPPIGVAGEYRLTLDTAVASGLPVQPQPSPFSYQTTPATLFGMGTSETNQDAVTRSEIDAKISASETRIAAEVRVLSARLDTHMEMMHKDIGNLRAEYVVENRANRKTAIWMVLGLTISVLAAFIGLVTWQGNWQQSQNSLLMSTILALHAPARPTPPAPARKP